MDVMTSTAPHRSAPASGAPHAAAARRVHRLGADSLLVDAADLADVLALRSLLEREPLPGQAELIPAAQTLLVRFAAPLPRDLAVAHARRLARAQARTGHDDAAAAPAREVTLPVTYDGEDLPAVADHLGCSEEEVIRRHAGARWVAAFAGFAPGFVYLAREDEGLGEAGSPADDPGDAGAGAGLSVPRREDPRTRVPAGSVGLAGEFSAVYPQDSPGGWQLIGRTAERMWDLARERPALLEPGTRVRFEPTREKLRLQESGDDAGGAAEPHDSGTGAAAGSGAGPRADGSGAAGADDSDAAGGGSAAESGAPATLRVDSPGLSTLIQDAGRPGAADLGVSPSGWADAAAARLANHLVGGPADTAVLEHAAGGLRLSVPEDSLADVVLALTGAHIEARITGTTPDNTPAPLNHPFALRAGQTLTLGPVRRGLRVMIGVRGGIAGDPVLGSLAQDILSGLGPARLQAGTVLRVGTRVGGAVVVEGAPVPLPAPDAPLRLTPALGPRAYWFTRASRAALREALWEVSEESNRVGVRLVPAAPDASGDAPDHDTVDHDDAAPTSPLRRTSVVRGRELPSEALRPGCIQIPPSGNPVVFLADHPVTGGYPVLGVVPPDQLRLLAQAPPGTRVMLDPAELVDPVELLDPADPGEPADPVEPTAPVTPSDDRQKGPLTCAES